ncbi:MAG TPA: NHL repeat-containing protein [Mucilaginibacter sp.]
MKYPYLKIIYLSTVFSLALLSVSCKKSSTATTSGVTIPAITTAGTIIDVTSTSAESGGILTSYGNGVLSANGVCYSSTNQTPTLADSKTTDPVSTLGIFQPAFISNITNLTPNTLYYVRAYATNSAGTGYGSIIKFTTPSNLAAVNTTVTTFVGNGNSGYVDGSGPGALFNNPQGVTVDSKNNIYVSDSFNNYVRAVTPGGVTSTIAGNGLLGYVNGAASTSEFYSPVGVVVDGQGNVYVSDFGNNMIRKITPGGVVSNYAGTGVAGYLNGAANTGTLASKSDSLARFNNPQGLAIDAQGNIYVADRGNNVVRKITAAGRVVTMAGTKTAGYLDATGAAAFLNGPTGVAVDATGNLYVSDQGNAAIRKITPAQVVTTIAGGPKQSAMLNYPSGIAIDGQGNLYITDEGGRILEYTTNSVLYILAGTANIAGFVNGSGATAQFNNPQGIAIDANGNIYVADKNNNCIRKLTVSIVP